MTTAMLTHADCLTHETPPGHPEQIARLVHVLHAIEGLELKRVSAPIAAEDDVLRIHPASYLADLRRTLPSEGRKELDADTWMSPGSLDAAFRAAGAVVRALDLVLSGEVHNAFLRDATARSSRRNGYTNGVLPVGKRSAGGKTRA